MDIKEFVMNIMLFLHWWSFINHFLLQTPWINVIEKTEGLSPVSQWGLLLKGRNNQNFQGERAVSEPNLLRSYQMI